LRSSDLRTVEAKGAGQKATFIFDGVVPGKYKVNIVNEQWCWKAKSVDIEIIDKDLTNIEFKQTGFMLSANLSHSLTLNFSLESDPKVVGSFNLTKGVNKFCLAQPGVYHLTPVSCHQFEQDVYSYDTSSPSVLSLVAVRHLLQGVVTTEQPQSDIMIQIRSGEATIDIGPLTVDNSSSSSQPPYIYRFQHWTQQGEKLSVTASSPVLLFYPPQVDVIVSADKCPGAVASFEGRLGVFIDGLISPPIDGVLVTILTSSGEKIKELTSDENGKYRLGPLDSSIEYTATAEKEGFVFSRVDDQPVGHFKSFKLGKIHVQVTDTSGQALSSVLLSLSGLGNYRHNNVTQDGGVLDFISLSPGEYYLRVMMKEFQFEPSSQLITVAEGDTVVVKVIGTRVEFSCYGMVTSLNGEPEPSVFVEALSDDVKQNCKVIQEESKTENDGTFRIRGLQPGCQYTVQLKSGDANAHIERSTPRSKRIQVVDGDVSGVNLIAFRRLTQMDISGNIVGESSMEHINTLKVYLYKESSPDSPVHTVSLGPTSFFYLSPVAIGNQNYILKLSTSLSHTAYEYSLPSVHFTANVSHRHFTLKFEPKRKIVDHDTTHSSFLILPFTLAILFIGYNYKMVLPWLAKFAQSVYEQSLSRQTKQSPTTLLNTTSDISQLAAEIDSTGIKKKPKAKKI
jgi:hypothetical protein